MVEIKSTYLETKQLTYTIYKHTIIIIHINIQLNNIYTQTQLSKSVLIRYIHVSQSNLILCIIALYVIEALLWKLCISNAEIFYADVTLCQLVQRQASMHSQTMDW